MSLRLLFGIRTLANAGGGAEHVLADLTGRLAARGHAVRVLTFDAPGAETFYPFATAVARDGIGVGDPSRSATTGESLRRVGPLRRAALRVRPDVAVGFMHSMFIPLGLALVGSGVPMVASEHTAFDDYVGKPWWHRVMRTTTPFLAARTVVPSPSVAGTYRPRLARRMHVLPNPVVAGGGSAGPTTVAPVILAVGRLTPEKDHATLLDAFAAVAPGRAEWRLDVLGEGELRGSLEARAARLGITERVRFLGVVDDVAAHLRRGSVLAVPSRYESFGLATAEALAAGLPAVGFADCPGTNELIDDGVNGLLVAGGSDRPARVAALADGLARLMDDAALRERLGSAGPASVARFDPEAVADAWEALLHDVVAGRVR